MSIQTILFTYSCILSFYTPQQSYFMYCFLLSCDVFLVQGQFLVMSQDETVFKVCLMCVRLQISLHHAIFITSMHPYPRHAWMHECTSQTSDAIIHVAIIIIRSLLYVVACIAHPPRKKPHLTTNTPYWGKSYYIDFTVDDNSIIHEMMSFDDDTVSSNYYCRNFFLVCNNMHV